jgi:hypothetical protein
VGIIETGIEVLTGVLKIFESDYNKDSNYLKGF